MYRLRKIWVGNNHAKDYSALRAVRGMQLDATHLGACLSTGWQAFRAVELAYSSRNVNRAAASEITGALSCMADPDILVIAAVLCVCDRETLQKYA